MSTSKPIGNDMNQQNDNRIIVVLGMHRSGTSAITRCLELLGVQLGDNLHPPSFDNPKGFWEDRDCLEINEQLLHRLDTAYDQLGLGAFDGSDPFTESLKQKAIEIVSGRIAEHGGVWGFKDPRTCRLLGFWHSVFEQAACAPNFLIALRNPVSVAHSLLARNQISFEKSYLLWLQHMVAAVVGSAGYPRVVVDYDLLMEEPFTQVARIAARLQLEMPPAQHPSVREYEEEFLDAKLRHANFATPDLALDERAPACLFRTHDLLRLAATDEVPIDAAETMHYFESLNNSMLELSSAFSYTNKLEKQRIELHGAINERDSQLQTLQLQVLDRDKEVQLLHQEVQARDEQINSLKSQATNLEQALNVQIEKANLFHRENARIEEQLQAILASKSWKITKPLRALRRYSNHGSIRSCLRRSQPIALAAWRRLPLSPRSRQILKSCLFTAMPLIFKKTQAFQRWQNAGASVYQYGGAGNSSSEAQYVPLISSTPPAEVSATLICFYLPQFHPIPENDEWWGQGFTEWTNVRPASPQFAGHYQPHIPGELGYYNLTDSSTQRRQIELAKLYGLGGFCFYFYWFAGKLLLETPIQNYLHDTSLDFPFCLCWANENWSRRWDGLDSEILIAQQHSPEDDLAFIEHVAQYMRDPRYIRVGGKPLLIVYRPSLLPSAQETVDRWRKWCLINGIGEIFLAYTQSFESVNPSHYGFDAAIEFPPNNSSPPDVTSSVRPIREDFGCTVYDWRIFVERSERYQVPAYKLFRSVCPSWDNTARRKNRSTIFLNSSPSLYQRWLENAIAYTRAQFPARDEQLIFVNAWNEWAEGAHLEPDQRYGYAWLQATRNALEAAAKKKIVIVSHDAHPHGAQLLALNLARNYKQDFGYSVDMIVLGGGSLMTEFREVATVHLVDLGQPETLQDLLFRLRQGGAAGAIVNTTVSGAIVPHLKRHGFTVVSLIHELPGVLAAYELQSHAAAILEHADRIVFPAEQVQTGFEHFVGASTASKAIIRPQGLYLHNRLMVNPGKDQIKLSVRQKLGIAADSRIILTTGYGDHRKGLDLFVDTCLMVLQQDPLAIALWVGHMDQGLLDAQKEKISAQRMQQRFIFTGRVEHPQEFYAAADVYALTSREDPYPSVVLEAYDALVPVVAFKNAGGFEAFLQEGCGILVDSLDTTAMANAITDLLQTPEKARAHAELGRTKVRVLHSFRHYLFDLLTLADQPLPRVSVVVPNYNYGRYLQARLESITQQTHPIYEIIVLDDASQDDGVEIAKRFLDSCPIPSELVINEVNSGSVFRQWLKGVAKAKGDFVWIAEADDLAAPDFLKAVLPAFSDSRVVMSFSQSRQMDERGKILADNYLDYVADIDDQKWRQGYIAEGIREIEDALCIKNTIPNVSAVVFRRSALLNVLEQCLDEIAGLRVAGDWATYVRLLETGAIAYCPLSLNTHRRHGASVTIGADAKKLLREIVSVQQGILTRLRLGTHAQTHAARYAQLLYEQFGLNDLLHPSYDQNPEIVSDAGRQ